MKARNQIFIFLTFVCLLTSGCKKHYRNTSVNQLRQAAPFSAKVERITVQDLSNVDTNVGMMAILWIRTVEGERLAIGGMRAAPEMKRFVESFRDGKTCSFPQVLLEFEKTNHVELK